MGSLHEWLAELVRTDTVALISSRDPADVIPGSRCFDRGISRAQGPMFFSVKDAGETRAEKRLKEKARKESMEARLLLL